MRASLFEDPEELIGQRLDGVHELVSVLGGGATAIVYSGRHLILNRPIALKLLHPTLALLPEMRARFLREAAAAAAVDHPGLVRVTDARVSAEGYHYIVMERLEGVDLATWAARRQPPTTELAAIGAQLADTLSALHEVGLVHRDLKPENVIVLDPPTAPPRVKLIDLGIVAHASGDPGARLTRADVTLGTVFYMSPEQAVGASVDGRSDIYALGCLLWELAVGQPWVGHGSPSEVLARHVGANPDAPSRHRPELPSWFDEVVLKCLAKKPEHRYQRASEVAERLLAAMAPEPKRRRPWAWSAAAAIALGLATGYGLLALGAASDSADSSRADARRGSSQPEVAPARPEVAARAVSDATFTAGGLRPIALQERDVGAESPVAAGDLDDGPRDPVPSDSDTKAAGAAPVVGAPRTTAAEVPDTHATRSDRASPAPKATGARRDGVARGANAAAGAPSERDAVGQARRARLTFAVEPDGSEVRRNGVSIGRTPLSLEVEASAGAVSYEVSHPERVTLKLVYPTEVDRVVAMTLSRPSSVSVAKPDTSVPGQGLQTAPTPAGEELWRPSRPTRSGGKAP